MYRSRHRSHAVRLTRAPPPELRLDFEAGAVVWGKILVEDKNRNSKFRSKYDPVPFFRLGFVYPLGS